MASETTEESELDVDPAVLAEGFDNPPTASPTARPAPHIDLKPDRLGATLLLVLALAMAMAVGLAVKANEQLPVTPPQCNGLFSDADCCEEAWERGDACRCEPQPWEGEPWEDEPWSNDERGLFDAEAPFSPGFSSPGC